MIMNTSVYIVSEHHLLRSMLCAFLSSSGGMIILGEASDGEMACQDILRLKPQLILLDIDLPKLSGLKLTGRVLTELPQARIIAVTEKPEKTWLIDFLRLGGMGYLHDCRSEEDVLTAIEEVMNGKIHLEYAGIQQLVDYVCQSRRTPARSAEKNNDITPDVLSERERQILHLYARGYNSSDMSSMLFVSINTIGTYIRRIREKLHLEHKADIVEYAVKYELYDDWR